MNIKDLQEEVAKILPILDANLSAANKEWMAGEIARGAFEYCLSRHRIALTVIQEGWNLDILAAFAACAPLTMDIRSGLDQASSKEQAEEWSKKLDNWWAFYQKNGFVEVNSFFNIPQVALV